MNIHRTTDREQIDMLKDWWHRYGKILAIAIGVGIVVGFGWRYWRHAEAANAEQASSLYQAMMTAVSKKQDKKVVDLEKQLTTEHSGSPYASLANLFSAKRAVTNKNLTVAAQALQSVVDNSPVKAYRQVARIRLARIFLAQQKPKSAVKILSTIDDKGFQPEVDNIKGDSYRALGDEKKAHKAYIASKNGFEDLGMPNPFIDLKLAQVPTHKS